MKERKQELRERVKRLRHLGLRTGEISQILGIPSRTVRYYLQGISIQALPLRSKVTHKDMIWIERLARTGASIEEISEILKLSGRSIFRTLWNGGAANTGSRIPTPPWLMEGKAR